MIDKTEGKTKKLTPMMRQYMDIKDKNPDTLLLYRMGDFYEMFHDDAKVASNVLGLTLTKRNHGGNDPTPLAGFPYHALDRYANRLVHAGHKIAICEQVEDPKTAKGLVKRDVVEIITAGTATEDNFINERSNNYIISIYQSGEMMGLSLCDLSTGDFQLEEIPVMQVEKEIARIDPQEILCDEIFFDTKLFKTLKQYFPKLLFSRFDGWKFEFDHATDILKNHFNIVSIEGLGLEAYSCGISAAGALLLYLKESKKNDLCHIVSLKPRYINSFAELDPASIRNLELLRPLQTDDVGGTLISVLDKTGTSMGARLLKRWITHPLKDIKRINERLDAVEWLKKDLFIRNEIELLMKSIADIERLISRVTFERANARDLNALKESLKTFPSILQVIKNTTHTRINDIATKLTGFEHVVERIESTIVDNPPITLRDGGIIRSNLSKELDEIKEASVDGKQWIAKLQLTERERTGIGTLKVSYNKVFGYYIEISKANSALVPDNYIRKQTLVNAERFITPELKEMEAKVLGADEKLSSIEYDLFVILRKEIAIECERIQNAADAIARLDLFTSLAKTATENCYCRPILSSSIAIDIVEGRHPVVELMDPNEPFVPNDFVIVPDESQIMLITGPNMAGKSTYLRQNALIIIMAQMGSFVPATSANIGLVDRFFTRIGASDRLARGQSTFLVEMIEVANILNNATDRSFVLLDEVGRGTSTFDGISIAWAVAEFLHEAEGRRARTLFATHYHELTELSLLFTRIKNLHIKVKEWNDKIIFLRKIGEGGCDHSYGIQVARLAGIPKDVINRAKDILSNLENMEFTPEHKPVLAGCHKSSPNSQLDLFDSAKMNFMDSEMSEFIKQVKNIDINSMTPIEALNALATLKKKANDF